MYLVYYIALCLCAIEAIFQKKSFDRKNKIACCIKKISAAY